MFVNKYTIVNSQLSGTTGYDISLSMSQNVGFVGQQESIESEFIETEVDKAVNVIYDYEKVKLLPKDDTVPITDITYNINLLETESNNLIGASSVTILSYSSSIAIVGNSGNVITSSMLALETSKVHNLKLGEKIVILSPLSNIFDKEFTVKRLDSPTVFVIDINPTPSNLALINGTITKSSIKKKSNFWSDIGFDYNDFLFKKKSFTKSFLRLDFYDSDIATNQNFISFITLYPKFSSIDIAAAGQGNVPDPTTYQLDFELTNTLLDRNGNGEGFALYHFKDEIPPKILNAPKHLYMKAKFNNAKTGISTGLISSNSPNLPIDELMMTTMNLTGTSVKNNLYTRYILTRDIDGYFYEIDENYSSNVTTSNVTTSNVTTGKYNIELYEISTM